MANWFYQIFMKEKKKNIKRKEELRKLNEHPLRRKIFTRYPKEFEVAIRERYSSVMEEFILLPKEQRISSYRATVCSNKADLLYFSFEAIDNILVQFPMIEERVLEISKVGGDHQHHYKMIDNYEKNFRKSEKKTQEILKKMKEMRRKKVLEEDKNIMKIKSGMGATQSSLKKPMSNGGYNTLLRGDGIPLKMDRLNNFSLEDQLQKSEAFTAFFNKKKKKMAGFSIKNYLKILKFDGRGLCSGFMKSFVVPDENLSVYDKLEIISKTKKENDKRRPVGTLSRIASSVGFKDSFKSHSRLGSLQKRKRSRRALSSGSVGYYVKKRQKNQQARLKTKSKKRKSNLFEPTLSVKRVSTFTVKKSGMRRTDGFHYSPPKNTRRTNDWSPGKKGNHSSKRKSLSRGLGLQKSVDYQMDEASTTSNYRIHKISKFVRSKKPNFRRSMQSIGEGFKSVNF